MKIKVLIVEDHEIVRQGIKALLKDDDEIIVSGEGSNGIEALEIIKNNSPDIVLMDMNMPQMNGLECTRLIKQKYPMVKILVLSMHDNENYLFDMMEAGANGYLLKNSSKDELLFAIKKIVNNSYYIGSEFIAAFLSHYRSQPTSMNLQTINLSEREIKVLTLIAEGRTNQEIADILFSSVRTIETQRKKILEKTGTTNTATLIRYAMKNGILQ
jgi:DNA-binding NarL/FixJ family response regulator